MVQGTISICIDRTKVDDQIARKEKAKLDKELKRQEENEVRGNESQSD